MGYTSPNGYNGYYLTNTGVYVPLRNYKESNAKGQQVTDQGYSRPQSLEQYIRWQLMASRRKYFWFHEMYRRDTWIRAAIDYVVRRATRDDNRLIDDADPLNPDIRELKEFLEFCYPDGDFTDLYRGIVQDMLEFGQGYLQIERTRGGEPLHLYPMESRITFPITDFHGSILFHAQVYNGQVEVFENDEVIYFPWRNNGTDPKSLPPMETLVESVAMELGANKYNAMLFENNLNIGAIFSVPGATDEDIEDNLRYLDDHYARPENAHRPLILKGDARLLRDGALAVKDINFELLIKLARHRVCSVFGVPESLLGIPDNTNRATGDVHERNTYVNTVRPLRRYINKRFTQKFIKEVWGSRTVRLEEPINSMLPTKEELEAVDTAASVGLMYNDILEMMGMPRVPNGDYFVMKGPNGTYQRLDLIAMPGLGDPHFDFDAYQLEHEQKQAEDMQAQQDMALTGMPAPSPSAPATPYIPPRSQDQIQNEPIAARIVDVTRSLEIARNEYSKKDRSKMKGSDFAGPHKSFPIMDQEDVYDAARLIGHADDPAAVKRRIISIAKRKGFKLPESWGDSEVKRADEQVIDYADAHDGLDIVVRRIPMNPGSRGGATLYTTKTGKARYGTPPKGGPPPATETPTGEPNRNTLTNPRDPNTPQRLTPEEKLQMSHAHAQVETYFRRAQQDNWTNEEFMSALEKEGWVKADGTQETFYDVRDARDEARRLAENNPDQAFTLLGADGAYFVMQKALSEFNLPGDKEKTQEGDRQPREQRERSDNGNVGRSLTWYERAQQYAKRSEG